MNSVAEDEGLYVGKNIGLPVVDIFHGQLAPENPSEPNSHGRKCPFCLRGVLPLTRNMSSGRFLSLKETDNCLRCGQFVRYLDIDEIRNLDNGEALMPTATAAEYEAKNIHKPVVEIFFKSLGIENPEKENSMRQCPFCPDGIIPVCRHPQTYVNEEVSHCLLCGQHVKFLDIESLRKADWAK
jgi:hypothetical protein